MSGPTPLLTRATEPATAVALASLRALAGAREPSLGSHLDRVGESATALLASVAPALLQDPQVCLAVKLHDLGKVAWPDGVLRGGDSLPGEAWDLIRRHPAVGADVLAEAGFDRAASIVRGHHERYDGTGYPDGLAGEDIPLASRVIAVVDTFDAVCENRSYRAGRSPDEARAIVAQASGTQLDPFLVHVFLEAA